MKGEFKSFLRKVVVSFFSLLFFLSVVISTYANEITFGAKGKSFRGLYQNVQFNADTNTIQLKVQKPKLPSLQKESYLYIPFDRYQNGQPVIYGGKFLESKFHFMKNPKTLDFAASFEQASHRIKILPDEDSFLYESKRLDNFSIGFFLHPYERKRTMEIFRKISFFSGHKYGIQALWIHEKVRFLFYHFFSSNEQILPKVQIETVDFIPREKWNYILLTYSASSGKLALYLNHRLQQEFFITHTGGPSGNIFNAAFHPWDKGPLVIGEDFLGVLDEILFVPFLIRSENLLYDFGKVKRLGDRFTQPVGSFASQVLDLGHSNNQILSFRAHYHKPEGTNLEFYLRSSNTQFLERDNFPRWIQVRPERKITNIAGRFVQWKAVFYANPQGDKTPVLSEFKIKYRKNLPPSAPIRLRVLQAKDEQVTLIFQRNAELDVIRGGRYHIYYGIEPYKALGVIRYKKLIRNEDGSWQKIPVTDKNSRYETKDLRFKNRLVVHIDNDLIIQNLLYMKENPSLYYENPLLQKGIPMYFWVTACDNAYSESPENWDHESKPSRAVVARP
ncbi:MAG: hypothetical protein D6767_07340 [Candidatus Hydrogenedentota bacterium]|nr:MAG: hypothetical protein D6767_07340 [Candidatus Hydrogenedentota bacterium]